MRVWPFGAVTSSENFALSGKDQHWMAPGDPWALVWPIDARLGNLDRRGRRLGDLGLRGLGRQLGSRWIANLWQSGIRDHGVGGAGEGGVAGCAWHGTSLAQR